MSFAQILWILPGSPTLNKAWSNPIYVCEQLLLHLVLVNCAQLENNYSFFNVTCPLLIKYLIWEVPLNTTSGCHEASHTQMRSTTRCMINLWASGGVAEWLLTVRSCHDSSWQHISQWICKSPASQGLKCVNSLPDLLPNEFKMRQRAIRPDSWQVGKL